MDPSGQMPQKSSSCLAASNHQGLRDYNASCQHEAETYRTPKGKGKPKIIYWQTWSRSPPTYQLLIDSKFSVNVSGSYCLTMSAQRVAPHTLCAVPQFSHNPIDTRFRTTVGD